MCNKDCCLNTNYDDIYLKFKNNITFRFMESFSLKNRRTYKVIFDKYIEEEKDTIITLNYGISASIIETITDQEIIEIVDKITKNMEEQLLKLKSAKKKIIPTVYPRLYIETDYSHLKINIISVLYVKGLGSK